MPAILVSKLVEYLASSLNKEKSVNSFFSEFTGATVSWLKPLFLKEDSSVKEEIKDLESLPNDSINKQAVEVLIQKSIRKNPDLLIKLKSLVDEIDKRNEDNLSSRNIIKISGNNNTPIQSVNNSSISINTPIKKQ